VTADPWDPPTTTRQPLLTPEEYEAIKAEIFNAPWSDPQRFPECLDLAVETLRVIGCGSLAPAADATQALRRMVQRSVSGVPFREPQEPAWSLDPDPVNLRSHR
jgi:hypothetical protein